MRCKRQQGKDVAALRCKEEAGMGEVVRRNGFVMLMLAVHSYVLVTPQLTGSRAASN